MAENNNNANNDVKPNADNENGGTDGDVKKNIFNNISAIFEKKTNVTEKDTDRLLEIFSKFNCTTVWSKVKRGDFTVRRFELGYIGDTCCCELTPDAMKRLEVKPNDGDCVGIVVKYKNKNLEKLFEGGDDSWINTNTFAVALAQKGLTPRLIYIDRYCSVQEYIPSRTYSYEDDCDPETVRHLARILAQIHCLRLPLSNSGLKMANMFKTFKDNPIEKTYLDLLEQDTQERKDKYYKLLSQMEPQEAILFATNLVQNVDSPVVMTQSDFNRTNRLVRETRNKDGTLAKKEIFIVDLDNGRYDSRGIDLGRYFSNYKHKENLFGVGDVAPDDEMLIFLTEYRAECIRLCGERYERDPRNSLEHLMLEAKAFTLLIHAFDSSFCARLYKPDSEKADYYLNATTGLYQCFVALKRHLTNDGTIAKILGSGKQ